MNIDMLVQSEIKHYQFGNYGDPKWNQDQSNNSSYNGFVFQKCPHTKSTYHSKTLQAQDAPSMQDKGKDISTHQGQKHYNHSAESFNHKMALEDAQNQSLLLALSSLAAEMEVELPTKKSTSSSPKTSPSPLKLQKQVTPPRTPPQAQPLESIVSTSESQKRIKKPASYKYQEDFEDDDEYYDDEDDEDIDIRDEEEDEDDEDEFVISSGSRRYTKKKSSSTSSSDTDSPSDKRNKSGLQKISKSKKYKSKTGLRRNIRHKRNINACSEHKRKHQRCPPECARRKQNELELAQAQLQSSSSSQSSPSHSESESPDMEIQTNTNKEQLISTEGSL